MSESARKMCPGDLGMMACRFGYAYAPDCGRPTSNASGICGIHSGVKCGVCGAPATHECSYCGQFVCGAPLCDDCEEFTSSGPSGNWGFLNHSHRRKADKPLRKMTAGDIGVVS